MKTHISVPILLALLALSACSTSMRSDSVHRNLNVITHDELMDNHFVTAYEAVSALRSNWLNTRGPDSFRTPSKVWVYLDNARMGGVESLSAIATSPVTYIQHYDGLDATSRWGVGHSAGVIYVATHPILGPRALQ